MKVLVNKFFPVQKGSKMHENIHWRYLKHNLQIYVIRKLAGNKSSKVYGQNGEFLHLSESVTFTVWHSWTAMTHRSQHKSLSAIIQSGCRWWKVAANWHAVAVIEDIPFTKTIPIFREVQVLDMHSAMTASTARTVRLSNSGRSARLRTFLVKRYWN